MRRGRVLSLLATLTALVFVAGCGSSGSDEVTVQTGSLSKAEFIKKADAICESAQSELVDKSWSFIKAHQSESSDPTKREALLREMFDSVFRPGVEGEIKRISTLGAPDAYAPEVASFLNALQDRLEKASTNPAALNTTQYPFKVAEDAAKRAGMTGCAPSA